MSLAELRERKDCPSLVGRRPLAVDDALWRYAVSIIMLCCGTICESADGQQRSSPWRDRSPSNLLVETAMTHGSNPPVPKLNWPKSPLATESTASATRVPGRMSTAMGPLSDSAEFLPADQHFQRMGAASCAAASCHGGPQPGIANPTVARGAEYSLWRQHDPHAQAYQSMISPLGQRMLRQLQIVDNGKIVNREAYNNCLRCHNTQLADPVTCRLTIREGVGCESCHGPSERWIDQHYSRTWNSATEWANGFVPLQDLLTRARTCAACHVGDDDRDMNHDLIAAGHPPFFFEFTSHHHRLPKHWREAAARDPGRFEAQLWFAGQLAALDAALALLESRATRVGWDSPWPEFAEYRCASCHQALKPAALEAVTSTSIRGRLPYSTWHVAGVRMLLHHQASKRLLSTSGASLLEDLSRVQAVMESAERSDAQDAALAANQAREALNRWLDEQTGWQAQWGASSLVGVVAYAASTANTLVVWEDMAQFYLAMVASREAWTDHNRGLATETAQALHQSLSRRRTENRAGWSEGREVAGPSSRPELSEMLQSFSELLEGRPVELE